MIHMKFCHCIYRWGLNMNVSWCQTCALVFAAAPCRQSAQEPQSSLASISVRLETTRVHCSAREEVMAGVEALASALVLV